MSAQEWQPEVLAQAAHGYTLAHFTEAEEHIGDCVLVRDLPKILAELPVPAPDADTIESLRVAMLGATDGDFIDPDSDIPAGEMFRLAAEWVMANLLASPVREPGRSEADAVLAAIEDFGTDPEHPTHPERVAGWRACAAAVREALAAQVSDTEGTD